jgi:hypothetical protein
MELRRDLCNGSFGGGRRVFENDLLRITLGVGPYAEGRRECGYVSLKTTGSADFKVWFGYAEAKEIHDAADDGRARIALEIVIDALDVESFTNLLAMTRSAARRDGRAALQAELYQALNAVEVVKP